MTTDRAARRALFASTGLRHADDATPGLTRVRRGRGFVYRDAAGRVVRDAATLTRIRALVIPPAWTQVWICPRADGHIQATGRDARGRKQYRYHPHWTAVRGETKYARLAAFAKALPTLRRRLRADLALPGLPRRKVVAAVVQLLEKTLIRVGNDEYARSNGSYGLTTMLDRHVDVGTSTMRFRFRGKSGKAHELSLTNPRLARLVKRCRDLPGSQLFQYLDADGTVCDLSSSDVNEYLREVMGEAFTAKDFRTWAGTTLTAETLLTEGCATDRKAREGEVAAAMTTVSAALGNTRAVCRRCYVHPLIVEAHLDGTLQERARRPRARVAELRHVEAAVLGLLRQARTRTKRPAASAAA